jgi:hypothetical protein
VLATIGHHLPYERAARLLAQLAGLTVSVGFLVKTRRRAADLLAPFMAWVRRPLHRAGLLHVDETTAHVEGGLTYLHVACNDDYTVMHTGGRSNDDIDAGGVLVDYTGIIVRDGYAGYQHYGPRSSCHDSLATNGTPVLRHMSFRDHGPEADPVGVRGTLSRPQVGAQFRGQGAPPITKRVHR